MNLPIRAVRYTFHLTARDRLKLSEYKGSTLRGGFGHAFKHVVCTFKGKPCDNCLLKHRCVYSYVFETLPPDDATKMTKYLRAPHPFVIEPPLEKRELYEPGDILEFGLVLIGRAKEYLPYFVYAFEELGTLGIGRGKGKYWLERVSIHGETIYDKESGKLASQSPLTLFDDELPGIQHEISLQFLTPTRLVLNEKLVDTPDFQTIFRTLLRRLSMLSYFHCGQEMGVDYKGLIERAGTVTTLSRNTRWWDWERYSARQDERMKMGGFVGTMTFTGNLEEFLPYLKAGELVHVGKGTGFGLGRYKMFGKEEP